MAFAPEVAEEGAFGVGYFLVFFAFIACIALRAGWSLTLGALFAAIGKAIRSLPGFHHFGINLDWGFLAVPFETADNFVYATLSSGIARTEHAFHRLVYWNAYVLVATGDAIAKLAFETLIRLRILHHRSAPVVVRETVRPVIKTEIVTHKITKVINRPVTKEVVQNYPQLSARVAKLEREIAHVHASTVVIPAPYPVPRSEPAPPIPVPKPQAEAPAASTPIVLPAPRTGALEHGLDVLKGEVGKLRKTVTVAGLLGIGAAVLGRLGLGWLKCSRVGRAGKQICGMDESLLESLLADTALIVGTISLVEFARGMETITADVLEPIRRFWRAV